MSDEPIAAREVELKLLLADRAAWSRLCRVLDGLARAKASAWTCYYFDNATGDLARARVMLRVRLGSGRARVTCKWGGQLEQGLMQVSELEWPAGPGLLAAWPQGNPGPVTLALLAEGLAPESLAAALPFLGPRSQILPLGAMRVERRRYVVPGAALGLGGGSLGLEVDRAELPGGEERLELEIEDMRAAELAGAVSTWLAGHGITWLPATSSKFEAFLAARQRARLQASLG